MDASSNSFGANEWELSKENVQPMKQGRKMANLAVALAPSSVDQTRIYKEKRWVVFYTSSKPKAGQLNRWILSYIFASFQRIWSADQNLRRWRPFRYLVQVCKRYNVVCKYLASRATCKVRILISAWRYPVLIYIIKVHCMDGWKLS